MKELDQLIKNIKSGELLPVYFFHGEEAYFIDVAVKALETEVLTEDEKAFNQTIAYGKDTNYNDILALARQYPMMGDKQVIIVKEAQELKFNEEEADLLEKYIENPVSSTILVIAHKHKKIDGRKKVFKVLQKNKMLFYSEQFRDYQVVKWIEEEAKNMRIKLAPNISQLLANYLGTDLSRVYNELNKLKMLMKPDEILDGKMVETHIGISKEFNIFELQKALGKKDAAAAFKIAFFMGKNPKNNPFIMTIGSLYNFFSNIILYNFVANQGQQAIAKELSINPFFVGEYAIAAKNYPLKLATRVVSILREMDMKSKGLGAINMDESELLKEMVYKILNVDQIKS